ncbi:unnamed protein product, partial [Allacma fusca]
MKSNRKNRMERISEKFQSKSYPKTKLLQRICKFKICKNRNGNHKDSKCKRKNEDDEKEERMNELSSKS